MTNKHHLLDLSENESYILGKTGEIILADRYLLKGGALKVGEKAVVVVDPKTNYHDLAEILSISQRDGKKWVRVRLRDGHEIEVEKDHVDVLKEGSPREMNARIAKGASAPLGKKKDHYEKRFREELLQDFNYIPGGRINASIGTGIKTTAYNCFVLPNVGPQPEDYASTFGRTLEIQARGGGVGMNLSLIPPKGTLSEPREVRRSDVQLVLDVWHPDLEPFLEAEYPYAVKTVRLSPSFHEAVLSDGDWTFEFPDPKAVHNYDEVWNGDIESWKALGLPVVQGEVMPARQVYDKIVEAGVSVVDQLLLFVSAVHTGDNRNRIAEALGEQWNHQLAGRKVAVILSSLRPRYAKVVGVDGRSSGAYSWGELYNKGNWAFAEGFGPISVAEIMSTGCNLIIQGGSRRGALMIVLNDWHADLFRFINAKRDMKMITGANISIGVTDSFMEAMKGKGVWELGYVKPDQCSLYEGEYRIRKEDFIGTEKVQAEKVWQEAMKAAHRSAEPGVFFIERYNKMSNSQGYATVVATNPCGEQGIPPWAVCNLGAVNLALMANGWFTTQGKPPFKDARAEVRIRKELEKHFDPQMVNRLLYNIKWERLETLTRLGLRFQDAIIDATYYPFKENEVQQKGERRVGLGFMGLHDLMLYNGIRYGSKESEMFCDVLLGMMAEWCYLESVEIAKEEGPFPFYNQEDFLRSGYMQQMAKEKPHVVEAIKKHGIRNVTTMTVAPTGTTGTSVGVATGCEPHFAWEYVRNSRLGRFSESTRIVKEYRDQHPEYEVKDDFSDLPEYFVTAMELTPEEHVVVQATLQKWIDSSISKTCNAPSDYSVEDVRTLYETAYDKGAKGITIYRYKSRDGQVLETTEVAEAAPNEKSVPDEVIQKRKGVLYGATYKKATPLGDAFITINDDESGVAREIIVNIGKAGSEIFAMSETIGRLATLYLKESPNAKKEAKIVKHLSGIGGQNSVGFGPNKITSVADAVAKSLVEHAEGFPLRKLDLSKGVNAPSGLRKAAVQKDLCPNCQQMTLLKQGGCNECEACGFSKC